jgi:hypothetical protein
MVRTLWHDNRGEISEYALILSMVLVLGMGILSQTGRILNRLYGRLASQQAQSGTVVPKSPR